MHHTIVVEHLEWYSASSQLSTGQVIQSWKRFYLQRRWWCWQQLGQRPVWRTKIAATKNLGWTISHRISWIQLGHLVCTETYCCRLQPGREGSRGRSTEHFLFVFVRFLEGSLPTQQRFVVSTGLTPPKTNISSPKKWWLEDEASFEHVC